nr:MAG TPA: Transcription factor WhiB [Caudoviricetes sp.]
MSENKWEVADSYNPWGKKRIRGTHCSKGHEFTEENTFTRAYDNARVCRECRKQYAREKYQRNKAKNNGVARPRKEKPVVFEIPESARILDQARDAWYNLQAGLDEVITPCVELGPDKFVDNPEWIDVDEAEELCYKCPLLKQCYDYAVADKIEWGIWGGVNFTKVEEVLFDVD